MKNNRNLTLLFWHRKYKADAKGYAPVICRITIEGEEPEELSIGRKVHLKDWDVENKRAKGIKQKNLWYQPGIKYAFSNCSTVHTMRYNFLLVKLSSKPGQQEFWQQL